MKREKHLILLCVEIVLLTGLYILNDLQGNLLVEVLRFPFSQIGSGLRELSLSSSNGNILSLIIYVIICILPCVILLVVSHFKFKLEDILIPVLSLTLFVVMYKMINSNYNATYKAILCGSIYSILICYIVFKAVRKILKTHDSKILNCFSALLVVVNMIFIATIMQNGFDNPFTNESMLDNVFAVLKWFAYSVPYMANVAIVFVSVDLLSAFKKERYSQACVDISKQLSKFCVISLIVSLSSTVLYNVLQLMFIDNLSDINITANIPVLAIMFILACLVFSSLVRENKELTDDSNSII